MAGQPPNSVWLQGGRPRVRYLLSTLSGRVVRREVTDGHGPTGGIGQPCGRAFLAFYVAAGREHLVLQLGTARRILDEHTRAHYRERLGGVFSSITVASPGEADLTAHQWKPVTTFWRWIDITYDHLDWTSDYFLAGIAETINSPRNQAWLLSDRSASPATC